MSCWSASRTRPAYAGRSGRPWSSSPDAYVGVVGTVVVAEVTKNLTMAHDPACLLIDTSTPEGAATGLVRDSVVSCLVLVTVYADA